MNRFLQYSCDDFCLEEGESLEMVIRRHWAMDMLLFLRWFTIAVFFPCIAFIVIFFVFDRPFASNEFWLFSWGLSIYFIFSTIFGFIRWLNSTFDIMFVTNDRVIDVTQVDFFHRNIIETRLENVQDATGEVKGFLNTLFDWGSIQIRTANDIADFSIDAVQSPQMRSRKIFSLADIARKQGKVKEMNLKHQVKTDEKKQKAKDDMKKEEATLKQKAIQAQKDAKKLKITTRKDLSSVKIFSKK